MYNILSIYFNKMKKVSFKAVSYNVYMQGLAQEKLHQHLHKRIVRLKGYILKEFYEFLILGFKKPHFWKPTH